MDDDTSGWSTLHEGNLKVWEGVCAVLLEEEMRLYKIRNGNILQIAMEAHNLKKVTSDGYWGCAEIVGTLGSEKWLFYYHADNPGNAEVMLEHISASSKRRISSLLIRLDPDPLRNLNLNQISERGSMWSQLGQRFFKNVRLVFDSNMPL